VEKLAVTTDGAEQHRWPTIAGAIQLVIEAGGERPVVVVLHACHRIEPT
jgi:hypothetical protein